MTKPVKHGWLSRRDYEDEIVDLERQIAEKDDQLMMCNRVAKGYSSDLKEGDTGWSYVIPTINYVIDRMVKAERQLIVKARMERATHSTPPELLGNADMEEGY